MNLKNILNFAIKISQKAGEILKNGQKRIQIVEYKDRQDICTNLDLEVENFFIKEIKKKFPDHSILSEEAGEEKKNRSAPVWIIDPIDGTKHYLRHLPLWSTSLALQIKNQLILGVVYAPMTGELFYAFDKGGAFLSGKKIRVSSINKLADAFIYLELPRLRTTDQKFSKFIFIFKELLQKSYRLRVFGLGSLGLCYLALGSFEAYLNLANTTAFYDLAAGLIIAKEAGAKTTDYQDKPIKIQNIPKSKGPIEIVASNGRIHQELMEILKPRNREL